MQLKQTHSISEYYGEFMAIAADLPWNEAPLVSRFYEGLKPIIKEMLVTFDKPQYIVDYLPICFKLETRLLARIEERKNETQYQYQPQGNQKTSKVNTTRLSPEERTRRMKEGLCFNCATKGHMARNCPMKTAQVKTSKEEKGDKEKKEEKDFYMGLGKSPLCLRPQSRLVNQRSESCTSIPIQ
jgi:hypothetical protein